MFSFSNGMPEIEIIRDESALAVYRATLTPCAAPAGTHPPSPPRIQSSTVGRQALKRLGITRSSAKLQRHHWQLDSSRSTTALATNGIGRDQMSPRGIRLSRLALPSATIKLALKLSSPLSASPLSAGARYPSDIGRRCVDTTLLLWDVVLVLARVRCRLAQIVLISLGAAAPPPGRYGQYRPRSALAASVVSLSECELALLATVIGT
ncbi:hypothetical protein DFH06DRAFT_1337227 [Mycena polygramma]|nr:hypothetical protein DFH06DRAFT_1337227 [Mycena polygramma]